MADFGMRLDTGFRPVTEFNRKFRERTEREGSSPFRISLARDNGCRETFSAEVLMEGVDDDLNLRFAERFVKSVLWTCGGFDLAISCDKTLFSRISAAYSHGGSRDFDVRFFENVYGLPFTVRRVERVPETVRKISGGRPSPGRNRIGLDCGGSDLKIAAVRDGEVLYSREIIWAPKENSDPSYHRKIVEDALSEAASRLPSVDFIGVSSAGIQIDNETRTASLFRKVPEERIAETVSMFRDAAERLGAPVRVCNDGDAAALAGAVSMGKTRLLGLAMGTSLAGGYIDADRGISGRLNELSFVPLDMNPDAPADDWSGDRGCGCGYLSQDGVIRLAETAGVDLSAGNTKAEKLKIVQALAERDDPRAADAFADMGVYLACAISHYRGFYDMENVFVLGRVSAGKGGEILAERARSLLSREKIPVRIFLPDERSRRVGQAVAAALYL